MSVFYGHQKNRNFLLESIKNKNLNSSLLFTGPASIGKKHIAFETAQALLCPSQNPCGSCPSCEQVKALTHPSLLFIEPDGLSIKIEAIQKIRSFIALQSSSSKIVIIDQAHSMNHQTQNALLKSLEEPPSGVYFILICNQIFKLLPTICSRTQMVRFQRLSLEDMKKILPEEKDWVLAASRGQLNRVHQWSGEKELYKEIGLMFQTGKISSSLSSRLKDRKTALLIARTLQEVLRDLRITQEGGKDWIHFTFSKEYSKWSSISSPTIDDLYQKACALEQDISSYLDSLLCFEHYWNQAKIHFQKKVSHVD